MLWILSHTTDRLTPPPQLHEDSSLHLYTLQVNTEFVQCELMSHSRNNWRMLRRTLTGSYPRHLSKGVQICVKYTRYQMAPQLTSIRSDSAVLKHYFNRVYQVSIERIFGIGWSKNSNLILPLTRDPNH